jgi:hypothetical protein
MAGSTFHRDVCFALEIPVRDTRRAARVAVQWWAGVLEGAKGSAPGQITLTAEQVDDLTFILEDLERRSEDMVTIMSGPQLAPVD